MKNIISKAAFSFIALAFALNSNAQEKQSKKARIFGKSITNEVKQCGSTEYEAFLQQENPKRATTEKFEQWIAPKVNAIKAQRLAGSTLSTNVVVTIPVVVHIIHNGDAIGTNENLAEEQILSQITVLNQDFRRMINTPGYNTNPVGADVEIEFCLAQRDPNGIASTGIIRYNLGSDGSWGMEDIENNLKPQTQWDPEQYLNIWVVNDMSTGFGELLGYAQFPTNSGLDGIDGLGQTDTANTDGVVIGALYFGSSDIYPAGTYGQIPGSDKGRTATHEIGHFLGLRHIWGDGNCSVDDFCADTPVSANANSGCNPGTDSCPASPGLDMIENYMDYTYGTCQNVFTINQKDRILAVLQNSPRRSSLTTSLGCVPGITYDLDGSLNINSLQNDNCSNIITPSFTLTNAGNNNITAATIAYHIDNEADTEYNWTGNISNGEDATINLPSLTVAGGEHTITATITLINGADDQLATNNSATTDFTIANSFDTTQIIVTVTTDDYGDETIWALLDENGDPIIGNIDFDNPNPADFYESNQTYTQTIDVEDNQCYAFGILDTQGDGICCAFGDGSYTVTTTDGTVIAQGGDFGQSEQTPFGINTYLSNDNFTAATSNIKLYPNPANNTINISTTADSLPESYTIYNSLGQLIGNGKVTSNDTSVDISSYTDGMYFMTLTKGNSTETLRFIKN
ncbi:MAG: hypothetical protein BM557_02630 [Flavobacterium sp. MedPE-SWcel]|uniref:M43 family zinc metalloprotease n=1 Tax=uncultured Flavobacterium sp. TaxID=165435 RepID=UPI000912D344|nr:M43 family zinc metalloprotease [uncultured Flavobacterium sp.]OIQ21712.1 MAG: hypothetical protein BM557_02630 [Flavobacterium sp. MedPE-SWcel]